MDKKIVIAGGSGFIGKLLVSHLLENGYDVLVLSRQKKPIFPGSQLRYVSWDGRNPKGLEKELEGALGVINLSGENIGQGRWTARKKERILESRVQSARALVEALRNVEKRPSVFIQASAVGFYGSSGNQILNETSPQGPGFLSRVCGELESELVDVESLGVRLVIIRLGLVLAGHGGAMPSLALPFRFFMGGVLGSGSQWVSWVHITDVIRALAFFLSRERYRGIYNLCGPEPVTNRAFAHRLGQVLNRPAYFKTPSFVLKVLLGEKAEALLLSGQRVVPVKLLASGFTFLFSHLDSALEDLLGDGKGCKGL